MFAVCPIAGAAEADLDAIIAWTLEQFGDVQAGVCSGTLSSAVQELVAGPAQPGIKARAEIGKDLFTLHVARTGRRGWHFVLFRADADPVQRQIDDGAAQACGRDAAPGTAANSWACWRSARSAAGSRARSVRRIMKCGTQNPGCMETR